MSEIGEWPENMMSWNSTWSVHCPCYSNSRNLFALKQIFDDCNWKYSLHKPVAICICALIPQNKHLKNLNKIYFSSSTRSLMRPPPTVARSEPLSPSRTARSWLSRRPRKTVRRAPRAPGSLPGTSSSTPWPSTATPTSSASRSSRGSRLHNNYAANEKLMSTVLWIGIKFYV